MLIWPNPEKGYVLEDIPTGRQVNCAAVAEDGLLCYFLILISFLENLTCATNEEQIIVCQKGGY